MLSLQPKAAHAAVFLSRLLNAPQRCPAELDIAVLSLLSILDTANYLWVHRILLDLFVFGVVLSAVFSILEVRKSRCLIFPAHGNCLVPIDSSTSTNFHIPQESIYCQNNYGCVFSRDYNCDDCDDAG